MVCAGPLLAANDAFCHVQVCLGIRRRGFVNASTAKWVLKQRDRQVSGMTFRPYRLSKDVLHVLCRRDVKSKK
jgi:hypothetical protein